MSLEWNDVVLKDVLSEKGYIRGPFGSALKRAEMKSEGIPVYEQQNAIYDNRIFRYYINEEKYQSLKRFTTYTDDLIISCSGTVGKVSIIKHDDPKGIISQALLTLRVNKDLILPEFLKYFFSSYEGYNSLVSRATGSVQVNISKRAVIEEIPLKLPPLDVQRKIVHYLSLIDKKIETNEKINKNLEEQIETIYNSFFVYYDDFSKEELEECEIGLIPKDWELMSLGEVTTKIKEKVGSDDYKVFSAVNTGNLILSEEYFDKQVYSKNIEKYIVVKQKEFAYNPARINIGSIGRNDFNYDGCVSPVYVAFKVEEGYENFMNMYIKSNRFNQWVVTLSSGSVRQTLNYADFSIIKIAYPPKDLVNKFNKVYDNYYEVINYNNSVISNLENIRDTLLPKLMSGEIDVSKINCDLKIIIRKIYIKSSKLFLWRYLSENKNYIKNTKSNETLLKSRTIYKINKFLAKFNARYRYYRQ